MKRSFPVIAIKGLLVWQVLVVVFPLLLVIANMTADPIPSSSSLSTSRLKTLSSSGDNDVTSCTNRKTIYLIRHAQSEENRRLLSLKKALRALASFSLPSLYDVLASLEFLNVPAQIDTNLSEHGKKQVDRMGNVLRTANFVSNNKIELVAHSPLIRARETSLGMLGCVAPSTKWHGVQRVIETDLLSEIRPTECVPGMHHSFARRMMGFENLLKELPEETIAIVGHSQYFRVMLKLDFVFGNCDVWKVTFHGDQTDHSERWKDLEPVFVCSNTITHDDAIECSE